MLSRSQRLSGEQLDAVMEKGRATHSSLFWMRTLKYEGLTKVAAIAPQKIAKTAVQRNSLRRKMYESIKPFFGSITPNHLIVVCAKEPVKKSVFKDLAKEMREIFVKSGLLK